MMVTLDEGQARQLLGICSPSNMPGVPETTWRKPGHLDGKAGR